MQSSIPINEIHKTLDTENGFTAQWRCQRLAYPLNRGESQSGRHTQTVSKRKRTRTIHISNPLPGSREYTSLRRARHFVACGRAVWVSGSKIEFVLNLVVTERQWIQRELAMRRQADPDLAQHLGHRIDWRGTRPEADQRKRGAWHILPGRAVS